MATSPSSELLQKLLQLVLDNEDNSQLVNKLFSQLLIQLSSVGLSYQFAALSFLDAKGSLQQTYFTDLNSNLNNSTASTEVIYWSSLLEKGSQWEKELLWGKPIQSSDVKTIVSASYPFFSSLKSCTISPVLISHRIAGALILGSSKQWQISEEEKLVLTSITNLLSFAYRLADTQTSLTKITQEVYKMNAQLHQLDKLKDDFVSIASHELRTPMTAIRSYSWMALHRADVPLSEKLKKYLERTLLSTERLIYLVNDMLNISRIESGRIEILPKAFNIQELTSEVLEEVAAKAREKNLNLHSLNSQIPQVFADPDKVHQVLLNLVGNAIKFTPEGGTISVAYFSDGIRVEVSVKDSGVGISQDDLARLFKKFGRLDNTYVAAATSGGTGLGLYISKSLIELMLGKIWASSEGLGKGSVFTFSLPVATNEVLSHAEKFTIRVGGEAKQLEPVAI